MVVSHEVRTGRAFARPCEERLDHRSWHPPTLVPKPSSPTHSRCSPPLLHPPTQPCRFGTIRTISWLSTMPWPPLTPTPAGCSAYTAPPQRLTVALRVPAHAPWLARRSLVHRVTRMTCHAPVRTGGAVGAGWDLDCLWVVCIWLSIV